MTTVGALNTHRKTRYRYHVSQRALHWAMAIVIICALALGLYCAYLPRGASDREFLMEIHKSSGMTALALIILRLPTRAALGEPAWRTPPSIPVRLGSHVAHGMLYVLMVLMPVTGYMTSGAEGRSIPWFGLFTWPNLIPHDRDFGRLMGTVHQFGAYTFFAVLGLHIAAVLWHRVIKRDEVLARMI